MTPIVVVGAAIVLNVGILVGGVIWARRQLKLVAAERAAASRDRRDDAPARLEARNLDERSISNTAA